MNTNADSQGALLDVRIRKKAFNPAGPDVISNLDFSASPGEFVAIIGPSGTGKSTLLSMISGLDEQYDGEIVRHTMSGSDDASRLAYTDVAFVFQEPRLMPWLSARDNVQLVLKENDTPRVDALLESVGLGDFAEYFPNQLSGGMQRRLSLIRAFIVDPAILLLDEPFVSLDAPTATQLRDQLIALWNLSKPLVIFVTHHLDEAITVADRIIFLSASPATHLHETVVDLPRPRRVGDEAVVDFRKALLIEYPEILEGHL